MITAKEAQGLTKNRIKVMYDTAKKWVDSEWEAFIEQKILDAIEAGKYEASYWWSNELLKEAGVDKYSAANALEAKASELGFRGTISTDYGNSFVLRIELRWDKI